MPKSIRLIILALCTIITGLLVGLLCKWAQYEMAIAIVLIVVTLIMYANGQKQLLFQIILHYVTEAEDYFGSSTGKIKFRTVYTRFMAEQPPLVRILFSGEDVEKCIDTALAHLKLELKKQGAITMNNGQLVKKDK